MKPTRNRVYCFDCGRQKMLFENQEKADNFIKFHQDANEFEKGYRPKRSYFCTACAGWHVTSIETYNTDKVPLSEQLIELAQSKQKDKSTTVSKSNNDSEILHLAEDKMNEVAIALKIKKVDYEHCTELLSQAYSEIQSVEEPTKKAAFKQLLIERQQTLSVKLAPYVPRQYELENRIITDLHALCAEIDRADETTLLNMLQVCKSDIDEMKEGMVKKALETKYHHYEIQFNALFNPSQLVITNNIQKKIVRSVCDKYFEDFEMAYAFGEYHICTTLIKKIAKLYEILSEHYTEQQNTTQKNRITNCLEKLSNSIKKMNR